MSLDKTTFDCDDLGSNIVTLTVVDLKGNSSTCQIAIIIDDKAGSCSCDGDNLQVNGQPIAPDNYDASNVIISTGTVAANTTVNFKAGNTIFLQPGFTVEPNGNFSAKIEQCLTSNVEETAVEVSKLAVPSTPDIATTIDLKVQPNPFRYQTKLVFNLSKVEKVNLRVFDQSGRMLKELLKDQELPVGQHEVELKRDLLRGGMYYISLQTETEHLMKKVIVISDGYDDD